MHEANITVIVCKCGILGKVKKQILITNASGNRSGRSVYELYTEVNRSPKFFVGEKRGSCCSSLIAVGHKPSCCRVGTSTARESRFYGGGEVEDGRVVSPCAMSGVSGDTVAS